MNHYLRLTAVLSLVFCFASCNNQVRTSKEMIGEWECVKIETKGENPPLAGITFQFNPDGTFTYQSPMNPDWKIEGQWTLSGQQLLTKTENGTAVSVQLLSGKADTLLFQQNREGVREVWSMLKKG